MNILIIASGASARRIRFRSDQLLVMAINRMCEKFDSDINVAADAEASRTLHWHRPTYAITCSKGLKDAPPHVLAVPGAETDFSLTGAPGVFTNTLTGPFALHIACMWLTEAKGGGTVYLAGYDQGGPRAVEDGNDHSSPYYNKAGADRLFSPFSEYAAVKIQTVNGNGALPFGDAGRKVPDGARVDKPAAARDLLNWLSRKYGCKKEF